VYHKMLVKHKQSGMLMEVLSWDLANDALRLGPLGGEPEPMCVVSGRDIQRSVLIEQADEINTSRRA